MRSVGELLKAYNFVNTPEGRKYTVRFFAGLFMLAVVSFALLFTLGGPDRSEDARFAEDDTEEEPIPPVDEDDALPELEDELPADPSRTDLLDELSASGSLGNPPF